jgi:hypothetical protein
MCVDWHAKASAAMEEDVLIVASLAEDRDSVLEDKGGIEG